MRKKVWEHGELGIGRRFWYNNKYVTRKLPCFALLMCFRKNKKKKNKIQIWRADQEWQPIEKVSTVNLRDHGFESIGVGFGKKNMTGWYGSRIWMHDKFQCKWTHSPHILVFKPTNKFCRKLDHFLWPHNMDVLLPTTPSKWWAVFKRMQWTSN